MKNTQPTFIIISPGFAKDETDSTCLPAQQAFVKALSKDYPEIKIIILALEYPFQRSTYQWKGNTVMSFNTWKKNKLEKISTWLSVWRTLNKLKQEYNIIGILSFWCTYCALIGRYFSKRHHLIYHCWILGQDAKKENKYIRWIKPRPNELIALSDFIAAEFYKNHHVLPGNIIPLGINPSSFLKQQHNHDIDVLGVGSLIPLKNYETFIIIIDELKKIFPDIKAVLCGKGPEEQQLKKMIAGLELESNISLTGERPYDEILKMMQRTKIFLHPSSYEGFGVVCIEALYAGAHVISFCNPMNEEIAHWHIVKTENEMLNKAIGLLQSNDTAYTPVMPFLMDDCAEKIIRLYGYKKDAILNPATVAHVSQYE
jgi:glycosyltransferase involved in cell wall biosynthesis